MKKLLYVSKDPITSEESVGLCNHEFDCRREATHNSGDLYRVVREKPIVKNYKGYSVSLVTAEYLGSWNEDEFYQDQSLVGSTVEKVVKDIKDYFYA